MIATRESYGNALAQLGEVNENIVVLDADLSAATKTSVFAKKFPNRFFNVGISEQDLIGTAAGLATCGKIPFASTFAMFATGRAYDQVRNSVCYPHLNVKIAATHAGLTVGEDGATHQSLEDINIMKALPGMTIFTPSDDASTKWAIKKATEINGPVYIRLTRPGVPNIYSEDESFEMSNGKIIGDGKKALVFSHGVAVHEAIKAKEELIKDGIDITIVDMITLKPMNVDFIVELCKSYENIFTIEDHNVIGGLGSIISDILIENCPKKIIKLGVKDKFGKSGKWNELLKEYEIDSIALISAIKENAK